MRTCSICDLTFARPFTLRRHMEAKHPLAAPLPVERRRGFGNQCQTKYTNKQFGKGYTFTEGESDIFDDDSYVGSKNDTESDTQSDDGESDMESDAGNDVKENDYTVLEWIAEVVDENLSPKKREKEFRNQFAKHMFWVHRFRKHPVYKKVMKTVKALRDGPHDYDIEESVFKAVRDRKYLLNDVLRGIDENSKSDDDSDTGESSSDEEQNVSYRATKKKFGSANS